MLILAEKAQRNERSQIAITICPWSARFRLSGHEGPLCFWRDFPIISVIAIQSCNQWTYNSISYGKLPIYEERRVFNRKRGLMLWNQGFCVFYRAWHWCFCWVNFLLHAVLFRRRGIVFCLLNIYDWFDANSIQFKLGWCSWHCKVDFISLQE